MPHTIMIRITVFLLFGFYALFGANAHAGEQSASFTSARTLMEKQEFKPAIKIIKKAQENGEDTIDMSLLMTEALAGRVDQVGKLKQLGIAKKIKKSMEHSLALDPKNLDAMEGLVQYHMQAPGIAGGDKDEAKIWVAKIIEIDALRGHMLGARLAGVVKDGATARMHLTKAQELTPDSVDAIIGFGVLNFGEKKYAQAIADFEKCLAIEPENIVCRYQLGKTADIGNIEPQKGKTAFEAIIASKPENKDYLAFSHYRLGNILKREGDAAGAKQHYEMAVEIKDIKPAKKALKEMN